MGEISDAQLAAIRSEASRKAWLKRRHGQGSTSQQSSGDYLDKFDEKGLATTADVKTEGLGGGIATSYIVTLADGRRGCFKPADGEARRSWAIRGIRHGLQTEREVGAWEVAKLVGMDDMVAPCVARVADTPETHGSFDRVGRSAGRKRGSFALWQDGDVAGIVYPEERRFDGDEDLHRAAMFDFIIGNRDRHSKNWVISSDGKIKLIDHGLSFGDMAGETQQRFLDRADSLDSRLTPKALAAPYLKQKAAIRSRLLEIGLPQESVRRVMLRIQQAASALTWQELRNRNYMESV